MISIRKHSGAIRRVSILVLIFLFLSFPLSAQSGGEKKFGARGPGAFPLGDKAEIKLPENFVFLNGDESRVFMTKTGNLISNAEVGTVLQKDGNWYMIFEFRDVGYVKDDDTLDNDDLLSTLKENQKEGNKLRKEKGISELNLIGWHTEPHYDRQSKNLEWGTIVEDNQKNKAVNYNIRILGRKGYMEATIVGDPTDMDQAIPVAHKLLSDFHYKSGERYDEFKDGDRMAEYGLAALITGGVVAVAAKSGLLGRFWKFIVLGVVGLGGMLKKIFSRKKE